MPTGANTDVATATTSYTTLFRRVAAIGCANFVLRKRSTTGTYATTACVLACVCDGEEERTVYVNQGTVNFA